MGLLHTVKNLVKSLIHFSTPCRARKKKKCLVVLSVIAFISSIIGVGLWIASAVLVYSKSFATSHEFTMWTANPLLRMY